MKVGLMGSVGEGGPIWVPSDQCIEKAFATELAAKVGVQDFPALYRHSLSNPDHYWDCVFDALGIVWRNKPGQYVDVSEGKAFPKWFVGGKINWVESVLQWGLDPKTSKSAAIITETEDGSVSSTTYGELADGVRRFAAGLRRLGLGKGDRIGLLMENGTEVAVSFLAISYLGAIAVPLFTGFGIEPIVSRLSSCGAKSLIITTGFYRRGRRIETDGSIANIVAGLPELQSVIIKGQADRVGSLAIKSFDWYALGREASQIQDAEQMDPNDPFMIVFTSGTTGKPKGTVHIHAGFPMRLSHDSAVHWNIRHKNILLWPADIGWIGGHQMIVAALVRGATLLYYDGAPDFPDWTRMPKVIEKHRVTHYGSFPTMIRGQAAQSRQIKGDTSSVQVLMTAGEVIDPEHFTWFQQSFGRGECPVINYTGGTEASGALLSNVIVKPIVPSAFNCISPGVSLDVFNDDGEPVIDRIGELVLLQPFVGMTKAFWNDRDRYLETYWSRFPDVWAHGDLARRTDDGLFYLLGRSDDTLKIAGKRLGPAEIEEMVLTSGQVAEAAAIGLSDELKGQKLVVFVVRGANAKLDDEQLQSLLSRLIEDKMGKPFRPDKVHVVQELPKNRSRKIMRRLIRDLYSGSTPGDLTSLENPTSLDFIRSARTSA